MYRYLFISFKHSTYPLLAFYCNTLRLNLCNTNIFFKFHTHCCVSLFYIIIVIFWVKKYGAVRGSLGCEQTERCPAARPECLCLPPSLPCSSKPAARVPGHPTDQRETDQRAEENVWSKCWISEKRMGEEGKEGLKRLRFPQACPSSSRSFERWTLTEFRAQPIPSEYEKESQKSIFSECSVDVYVYYRDREEKLMVFPENLALPFYRLLVEGYLASGFIKHSLCSLFLNIIFCRTHVQGSTIRMARW